MPNNLIPTQCEVCGAPVKHIPAGVSQKTGRPYPEFWACSNRQCGWTWHPQKTASPQKDESDLIIFDELQDFRKEINQRLDSLAEYLLKKLGK